MARANLCVLRQLLQVAQVELHSSLTNAVPPLHWSRHFGAKQAGRGCSSTGGHAARWGCNRQARKMMGWTGGPGQPCSELVQLVVAWGASYNCARWALGDARPPSVFEFDCALCIREMWPRGHGLALTVGENLLWSMVYSVVPSAL